MKPSIPLIILLFLFGCASQPEPKKDFFNTQINQDGWRVFSFSVPIPETRDKKDRSSGKRGKGHGRGGPGKGPRPPKTSEQSNDVADEKFNQILDNKLERQLNKYPACSRGYEETDRYFGTAYMTIKGRCLVKPK